MNEPITEIEYKVAFEAALKSFVEKCEAMIQKHYEEHLPNLNPPKLVYDYGKRYARVWKKEYPCEVGTSIYVFVDTKNGDVLKAASWKAPAKHARSNIFDADNGMSGVTVYGGAYLR